MEKGRWHSLECLENGSVLLEGKDGRYEPQREEKLFKADSCQEFENSRMELLKGVVEFRNY